MPVPGSPPCAAEVLRRLGPGATLSHEEAARRLGIELVDGSDQRRVTVARNRSRLSLPGWDVKRADLRPDQILVLPDGHRVTGPARTVADLAQVLPFDRAVAAADSALRLQLVTAAALVAGLLAATGRGAARLRAVAAMLDPLSGSVFESLLRVALVSAGLPHPVSQYAIRNEYGRVVARADLCWVAQRLVVEADGFAFHHDRLAYRRDRARMNELERLGWRVLRITWEELMRSPSAVVELVVACLDRTAA